MGRAPAATAQARRRRHAAGNGSPAAKQPAYDGQSRPGRQHQVAEPAAAQDAGFSDQAGAQEDSRTVATLACVASGGPSPMFTA
jgi:hypothetical protein